MINNGRIIMYDCKPYCSNICLSFILTTNCLYPGTYANYSKKKFFLI